MIHQWLTSGWKPSNEKRRTWVGDQLYNGLSGDNNGELVVDDQPNNRSGNGSWWFTKGSYDTGNYSV